MLTQGKSPELYCLGQFLPYYFSSQRREELLVRIGQVLPRHLSLWRQLTGWHGAPGAGGAWGGPSAPAACELGPWSAGFN